MGGRFRLRRLLGGSVTTLPRNQARESTGNGESQDSSGIPPHTQGRVRPNRSKVRTTSAPLTAGSLSLTERARYAAGKFGRGLLNVPGCCPACHTA